MMPRRSLAVTIIVAVTLASAVGGELVASAQNPRDLPPVARAGAAVVAGTVVETSQGGGTMALGRVLVTLIGGGGAVQATTDSQGRFAFAELPGGRYTVTAEKPAYIKTFHGSPRLGRGPAAPIPLAEGQRLTNLVVRLVRGAVIEGTLRDADGTPLPNGQVRLMRPTFENGQREFVDLSPLKFVTTDDRGVFRFFGLLPGEYTAVAASGGSGLGHVITQAEVDQANRDLRALRGAAPATVRPPAPTPLRVARATTLHPGTASPAEALTVTVEAGDERTGVDIVSRLTTTVTIAGMAVGPDGSPATGASVGVHGQTFGSYGFSPGIVRPGPDGRWQPLSVVSGRYLFYGQFADPSAPGRDSWLNYEITIDQDNPNLVLPFERGVSVAGRVIVPQGTAFRGGSAQVVLRSTSPTDASPRLPVAPLDAAGTFAFPSVPPGTYRLSLTGTGAWTAQSAVLDGHDVLDAPLEVVANTPVQGLVVTMTDRPSEISGTLFDQLGRPAPEYAVVVFPVDPVLRRSAPRRSSGLVRLGTDGKYSIVGLPAGEYFLAAVTDLDPTQLTDPELVALMSASAVRIRLADGERRVEDVKIGP